MKKPLILFTLFALLLSFSACSKEEPLHVDMQSELRKRPTINLSLEDGTSIPGISGNYCTAIVCMNFPDPDFSTLSYTPYTNGTDLFFTVEFTDSINALGIKTLNTAGEVTHRELPYTMQDANTFVFEEPFPDDEKEIVLHILIDFVNEGRAHYYFPLQLQ
ncbi:MAG: hypothetical protein WC777_03935 [Candidatus Gracilibacteria bacterium]|jgi:hypothetical protein